MSAASTRQAALINKSVILVSLSSKFFFLTSSILIGVYFGFVLSYSSNIPNADDFDMLLGTGISFYEIDQWPEYFKLLFSRHGEHIVFTSRFLAVLSSFIFGSVHFGALILIGNLSLIATFFLLVRSSNLKGPDRFIYLLPVPFFLFQPQYVESSLWASGATQHLMVMPFVILSFAFAAGEISFSKNGKGILACFLFSVAALLTQGNGIFVLPIAAILLLGRGEKRWAVLLLIVSVLQFFLFAKQARELVFEPLFSYIAYSLGFLGSTLAGSFYSSALNAIALVVVFLMAYQRMFKQQPVIFAVAVFLGLTALSNSLVRIQFGIDAGYYLSRYHFPAALFLIMIWLGAVNSNISRKTKKILSLSVAACSLFFLLNAYRENYPEFILRNNNLRDSVLRFQTTSSGLSYPDDARATKLYHHADRLGIYTLPEADLAKFVREPKIEELKPTRSNIIQNLEHSLVGPQYITFSGYAFPSDKNQEFEQIIIRLKSETHSFSLYTEERIRPDVDKHHFLDKSKDRGFFGLYSRLSIPDGAYRIFVVLRNNSDDYYVNTGKKLILRKGISA